MRPWLYALVIIRRDTLLVPALIVLDRRTLTPLGVLPAPATNLTLWRFGSVSIVPSPLDHHVFVVGTYSGYNIHQSPAQILRFDTVP